MKKKVKDRLFSVRNTLCEVKFQTVKRYRSIDGNVRSKDEEKKVKSADKNRGHIRRVRRRRRDAARSANTLGYTYIPALCAAAGK